jgi:hypothetical protein
MRFGRTWLALALLALVPAFARASGYGIDEQGAAVLGMGGAGTASVHDASAMYFNPAAMTALPARGSRPAARSSSALPASPASRRLRASASPRRWTRSAPSPRPVSDPSL